MGFPRIGGVKDTWEFAATLRDRYETGVVPGRFFEMPSHFRVAMGGRKDILEQGLSRLAEALEAEL